MSKKIAPRPAHALKRRGPTREQKPFILLFCEGKNTEPAYFDALVLWLRPPSVKVLPIGDQGLQRSVVENAIKQKVEYADRLYSVDPVWCVFDADPNPGQASRFNEAIGLAEANGLRVAWSNQAFEYWLLLHFQDHAGGAMERDEYHEALKHHLTPLGATYAGRGAKQIPADLFAHFLAKDKADLPHQRRRLVLAHRRAARNHQHWQQQTTSPAAMESCTTVYELVEMLLRLALPPNDPSDPPLSVEELVNRLA